MNKGFVVYIVCQQEISTDKNEVQAACQLHVKCNAA